MSSILLEARNVYEDFEVETDILFFKVGDHDLVIFHGRNYNIKKRMSAQQLNRLLKSSNFYQVYSGCYVNLSRISSIEDDCIFFGEKGLYAKNIRVPKRKQESIRHLLKDLRS
ncbi:LytTR family transcriptional regulator DNA-binding domain-containing protein [Paenibacillus albidus]|uniref:LytTR family transcriptional regulator DNA-binding domain-containing protein n=1 Tax=Paenibacillus albidus TaxID=2041023 RepID=UPI001BEB10BD|nr:LytTR family transcriptional regulator DNA-binding domain-containing protein [Paenibacillus albidus]MBT2293626.1 LytTR family transcriptional regulator DNA-binding domain-containing protein [Paenibacillus albidus]